MDVLYNIFPIFTFFLSVLMCILNYANYVYSSSNEQFSRPSWRESIRFETISPGEIYDSCCDPGVDYLHTKLLNIIYVYNKGNLFAF